MNEERQIEVGSLDWYAQEAHELVKRAEGHGLQMVVVMRERNVFTAGGSENVACIGNAGPVDTQSLALWMSEKAKYELWTKFAMRVKEGGE